MFKKIKEIILKYIFREGYYEYKKTEKDSIPYFPGEEFFQDIR